MQELVETQALLEDACRELREEKEKHEQTRLEAAVTWDALVEDRVDELISEEVSESSRETRDPFLGRTLFLTGQAQECVRLLPASATAR